MSDIKESISLACESVIDKEVAKFIFPNISETQLKWIESQMKRMYFEGGLHAMSMQKKIFLDIFGGNKC